MVDVSNALRITTVASFGTLCLLVIGVGVVAFVAELSKQWIWYLRMEQAMALATPAVIGLLGLSITSATCLVMVTDY